MWKSIVILPLLLSGCLSLNTPVWTEQQEPRRESPDPQEKDWPIYRAKIPAYWDSCSRYRYVIWLGAGVQNVEESRLEIESVRVEIHLRGK